MGVVHSLRCVGRGRRCRSVRACVEWRAFRFSRCARCLRIATAAVRRHSEHFTISGTVTGLSGTGLVLADNGGDDLAVTANGSFTFATAVPRGMAYSVTVATQPANPAQNCVVTNASGTVVGNVSTVAVACTNSATTYSIGGAVAGLTGTGLVLQDNGGDNLSVAAGATTFTFATKLASGSAYAVTVKTQPTSLAQTCTVASGSGTATANVTNVAVTCTTIAYSIGGTVSGLSGMGLVLQDNGGDNLAVSANGSFTSPRKWRAAAHTPSQCTRNLRRRRRLAR